jgi:hypothetical protein
VRGDLAETKGSTKKRVFRCCRLLPSLFPHPTTNKTPPHTLSETRQHESKVEEEESQETQAKEKKD